MSSITGAANPTAMTNSQSPNAADAATADFSKEFEALKHNPGVHMVGHPRPIHPMITDTSPPTISHVPIHADETYIDISRRPPTPISLTPDGPLKTTALGPHLILGDRLGPKTDQGAQPVKDAPAAAAASVANQANQDIKDVAVAAEHTIAGTASQPGQGEGAAASGSAGVAHQIIDGTAKLKDQLDSVSTIVGSASQVIADLAGPKSLAADFASLKSDVEAIKDLIKPKSHADTAAAESVANHANEDIKDVAVAAENTIAVTAK
ncbi:hypothetical protein [Methylobacterium sp. J-076]|uniref:hypothetical protein n=1 Tax=Methylobacterium sp. J-076 TaxID=2836655 RepID=UPI001FBA57FE|nr:hypothetical protein [Methylobacterium sp. J-076]MCJ2011009.1 hypothetical protein [Methylobacterium sp. J-076]